MTGRPVVLLTGRGGQDRDVLDAVLASGREVAALLAPADAGPSVLGIPVAGDHSLWPVYLASADFVITVAQARRRELAAEITARGGALAPIVHPAAVVSPFATVLPGAMVLAGSVVAPDATIGSLAILNANCAVDHDCMLGAAVQFGPGVTLAGGVTIGDEAFLGVGATVMPGITIGARAIVGAGAVVIRDVPPGATVVGNPARPLQG